MSDANQPKGGGLWARLFGFQNEAEDAAEKKPEPIEAPAEPPAAPPPEAPVDVSRDLFKTIPIEDEPAPAQKCQACGAERRSGAAFCHDCGWMFPADGAPTRARSAPDSSSQDVAMAATANGRVRDRYELGALMCERQGVRRHQGVDQTTGVGVIIVSAPMPEAPPVVEAAPVIEADVVTEEEIMPGFDEEIPVAVAIPIDGGGPWPSIAWEKSLLEKMNHPAFPRVLDQFSENNIEYLVLEAPLGLSLWDAWDEPENTAADRYGWLQKVAAALQS